MCVIFGKHSQFRTILQQLYAKILYFCLAFLIRLALEVYVAVFLYCVAAVDDDVPLLRFFFFSFLFIFLYIFSPVVHPLHVAGVICEYDLKCALIPKLYYTGRAWRGSVDFHRTVDTYGHFNNDAPREKKIETK